MLSIIGEGGMGRVYLAEHEAIQKKVALKVLRHEYSVKPDIVDRFQQEAISASRIKHPNVLDVFDFGQLATGSFFLAMEHLEGIDLADELQLKKKIDPRRGVRFALQMCRALGAAHGRGVVHRDMKPENVFLQRSDDGDELVKILDFGIAQLRTAEEAASHHSKRRLTRTGMIFGTPEYMAPEQATGSKADLRVDVYAVGIILFEMFTGAVPYTGGTFMGVLTAHVHQPLPNMRALFPDIAITPQLQQVIEKALAKNPDERFQSMNDFAAALLLTPEGARHGSMRPLNYTPLGNPAVPERLPPPPPMPALTPPTPDVESSRQAPTLIGPGALEARAQTQLGAEALSEVSFRPQRRWPKLLFGMLLLGGAGAAALELMPIAPQPMATTVPDGKPAPAAGLPATPPIPAPAAAPAPPPAEPAAPAPVKLHVSTTPEGALIMKDGFQVCDATPCDISVAPNDNIVLEARKGQLRGQAKVLAQQDQTVAIALSGPAAASARRPASKERLCEVEVDGLKILRPCQ